MSGNTNRSVCIAAVTLNTDDAVGVPDANWYVAIMRRPRSEKAAADTLAKQGYEVYVATQKLLRQWSNGRRRYINHVVIPSVVFIHCTEDERLQAAHNPYISRYMLNRADGRKIAVIPDKQIDNLKFMLGQSDIPVEIADKAYRKGDKVRVVRGSLVGLEGEVMDINSAKSELTVSLPYFGCAKLVIDTVNLELVKDKSSF